MDQTVCCKWFQIALFACWGCFCVIFELIFELTLGALVWDFNWLLWEGLWGNSDVVLKGVFGIVVISFVSSFRNEWNFCIAGGFVNELVVGFAKDF